MKTVTHPINPQSYRCEAHAACESKKSEGNLGFSHQILKKLQVPSGSQDPVRPTPQLPMKHQVPFA